MKFKQCCNVIRPSVSSFHWDPFVCLPDEQPHKQAKVNNLASFELCHNHCHKDITDCCLQACVTIYRGHVSPDHRGSQAILPASEGGGSGWCSTAPQSPCKYTAGKVVVSSGKRRPNTAPLGLVDFSRPMTYAGSGKTPSFSCPLCKPKDKNFTSFLN